MGSFKPNVIVKLYVLNQNVMDGRQATPSQFLGLETTVMFCKKLTQPEGHNAPLQWQMWKDEIK